MLGAKKDIMIKEYDDDVTILFTWITEKLAECTSISFFLTRYMILCDHRPCMYKPSFLIWGLKVLEGVSSSGLSNCKDNNINWIVGL